MSALPSGSIGSTGTNHSATVINAQRMDGTTRRPHHHAVSSTARPTIQQSGTSTPCSPRSTWTGVSRAVRVKPRPPRYAATATSALPARPPQRTSVTGLPRAAARALGT
jgi:hypothetical protein